MGTCDKILMYTMKKNELPIDMNMYSYFYISSQTVHILRSLHCISMSEISLWSDQN